MIFLLVFEIIYSIIALVTLILFIKGNLSLEIEAKWYSKVRFLFWILYSIAWPIPWGLLLITVIKQHRKRD